MVHSPAHSATSLINQILFPHIRKYERSHMYDAIFQGSHGCGIRYRQLAVVVQAK